MHLIKVDDDKVIKKNDIVYSFQFFIYVASLIADKMTWTL